MLPSYYAFDAILSPLIPLLLLPTEITLPCRRPLRRATLIRLAPYAAAPLCRAARCRHAPPAISFAPLFFLFFISFSLREMLPMRHMRRDAIAAFISPFSMMFHAIDFRHAHAADYFD